jgi:hypothetical protein
MNDVPRQKLAELITRQGRGLLDDPRRTEALLRDVCGNHPREVNVLITALRERVPQDLLSSQGGTPKPVMIGWLVQRLEDEAGLAKDAAQWAAETWALALGVVSPADLPGRSDRAGMDSDTAPTATPPPFRPPETAAVPAVTPPAPSDPPARTVEDTARRVVIEEKRAASPSLLWLPVLGGFAVAAVSTFLPLDGPRSMWDIFPLAALVVVAPAIVGALLVIARRLKGSVAGGRAIPTVLGALYPAFGIVGWLADSTPPPSVWLLMAGGAVAAVCSFLDRR